MGLNLTNACAIILQGSVDSYQPDEEIFTAVRKAKEVSAELELSYYLMSEDVEFPCLIC